MAKATGRGSNRGCKVTREKRLGLYIRHAFTCAYCGRDLRNANPNELTLDHLIPQSTGGTNDVTNLILACRACNCSRQDKPWIEYATGGARDRIEQLRNQPINVALAKAIIAGTAGDPELENR
jgi:5-methylcytosine-specific restriction endonuclease McrA